jgi:hypothetical protein
LVLGSQIVGGRQSPSLVQAERQAVVPLQTYGAQGVVLAGWQTPSPLQVRPEIAVDWPAGQDGAAHDVVAS